MEKRLRSSLKTSADEFLSSAAKLGLKTAKSSLKTLIHSLSPSSALTSSLPLSLHRSISLSVPRFNQTSASPASSPPTKRQRRSKNSQDSDTNQSEAQNLQVYTYISHLCISHPKKIFPPLDLLPAVKDLHDNLIVFASDAALCSEIVNLCEEWWKYELPERETLITQSLPYLLSRSLTLKKKVDVHRIYAIREAFTLFDFEDKSIEDVKLLLMRCLISPLYLKTEDGKKFVAFIFGLSAEVAREGLTMIKAQISFGRKSTLEAYADVVFRAWKAAEGEMRIEIESGFLQGMIEGAIHASSASLAASIRRVLGGFFSQRTMEGVEKLLFRLAEPVIFRSLQVANSNVRQNALHLLLDMFPLEDPDCTKEAKDTLHQKQFFLLERLLMDDSPDVRVVAVEGSCRILNMFWEIIPSSTITKMITNVFDVMAHDTCSDVRLSTLNGITYLLGNPQSHDVLKVLLPRLGHLIHDSAISVRAAIVDLLLLLRDIRTFEFHKVVHMDALLSTLANDQSLIAQKITKLLMPSYFPSRLPTEEACNRCIALIKRSPRAGARFCEFTLSEGAPLHSLLELLKVLINLALHSSDQIDDLLVAASYICKHVANEASYKDTLKELLSGENLKCLFLAAASRLAQSSVCEIISSISTDGVDGFFEKCMALVTSCGDISENMEKQTEVRSVHKMMLTCNWLNKMFECMVELLQKTVYGCHTKFGIEIQNDIFPAKQIKLRSSTKKGKQGAGRKYFLIALLFEEDYLVSSGIAWQLKDLLKVESTRKALLESQSLDSALIALKVISEVSIVHCMCCHYMHESPVLAYTGLALHASLQNVAAHGATEQKRKKRNLNSAGTSSEPTIVDRTIDHLFDCTNKLFEVGDSGKFCQFTPNIHQYKKMANKSKQDKTKSQRNAFGPSDAGFDAIIRRRISNMMKILSTVLKFFIDASTTGLVYQSQERFLKFTLNFMKLISTNLKQYSLDKEQFDEEDLKESFLCLKSSLTYAAKLLHLTLANSGEALSLPTEAHNLANTLLDLTFSVELYLGTSYATRVITVVKPWLPDLVLALGSKYFRKQNKEIQSTSEFPLWVTTVANIEIQELNEVSSDEEIDRVEKPVEFPAFKKLLEMLILFVRGESEVLEAVGLVLMASIATKLKKKEFGVALGLIYFVCKQLVRHEEREWGKLDAMLDILRELYPKMQKLADEMSENDGEMRLLQSGLLLLEPIWTSYVDCAQE